MLDLNALTEYASELLAAGGTRDKVAAALRNRVLAALESERTPRPAVHDTMLNADGMRARLSWQDHISLDDVPVGSRREAAIERKNDRITEVNKGRAPYLVAEAVFYGCSDRLRQIDGDSHMRDRHGRKMGI